MQIKEWIESHKISATVDNRIVVVEGVGPFYIVYPKENNALFDTDFNLLVSQQDRVYAMKFEALYWLFLFGERWYYTDDETNIKLQPFTYLGQADQTLPNNHPHLGIHGRYELMNGTRDYSAWCRKAKFLGFSTLGIAEKHTLAGIPAFQDACETTKIKPIIGLTISVKWHDGNLYDFKFYAINEMGWRTLLLMAKKINVDKQSYLETNELFNTPYGGGCLICIIPYNLPLNSNYHTEELIDYYWKVYYQLDLVEWGDNDTDRKHLECIQQYMKNHMTLIPPILLNDSYYLEKHHSHIKAQLNQAGKSRFQRHSSDQYFKNTDDIWQQFICLFEEGDLTTAHKVFKAAVASAKYVGKLCNFRVDTQSLHLPKYEMTELEGQYFKSNEALFTHYIKRGYQNKVAVDNGKRYQKRIHQEMNVIVGGGFVDYFLILADIVKWAHTNKILTGIGRGSAGGSLVAYIMSITRLDPLKYDLLFERFLNESRIPKAIEVDVVQVETEEGTIELDLDQRILISRDGKEQYVLAEQLQDGDDMINY